jgi:hypothetical protein
MIPIRLYFVFEGNASMRVLCAGLRLHVCALLRSVRGASVQLASA